MLAKYYADPNVRSRMLEFLGGRTLSEATAMFITADGDSPDVLFKQRPVMDLWNGLEQGKEIARSFWDRDYLIVDLDIEYVNFDFPASPYVQPKRAFELQQPIAKAIEEQLLLWGIAPLHLISGRGHHFIWKICRQSDAFARLCGLGHLSESLRQRYCTPHPTTGETIDDNLGSAFSGLGMVVEYFGQKIMAQCQETCEIPIQLAAVEVGPGKHGREMISIDLSEYGDDLYTRCVRMPFSVYLKPEQQRYCLGDPFVNAMPYLFSIPLHEMDVSQAIEVMRCSEQTAELAGQASVQIPESSDATLEMIDEYARSKLARFHDSFYSEEHESPESWESTYDRTPLKALPDCIRQPLKHPNELLLKPAVIQNVTRAFMAKGWSPRHIAGLIRSKYERDCGWGDKWFRYDATSRADFYVRLFAGQIVTGTDRLTDFNCRSTQEKQYCSDPQCGKNLVDLQHELRKGNAQRTQPEQVS